jgi:hypothetical protein
MPISGETNSRRGLPDMAEIAGHTFVFGRCACGVAWTHIRNVTKDDVNQKGIAHSGSLTEHELSQIQQARAAEEKAIEQAMASL